MLGNSPELPHVAQARKDIGVTEVKGPKHNKRILSMLEKAFEGTEQKQFIFDDETAWCGTFLADVFIRTGLAKKVPKLFYRAKEWANAGTKLTRPCYGCVVVFSREGGGHVGIVVGVTKGGMLKVLGGNQADQVNISDFDTKRVIAYRWVSAGTRPLDYRYNLPVLPAGRISTNEA